MHARGELRDKAEAVGRVPHAVVDQCCEAVRTGQHLRERERVSEQPPPGRVSHACLALSFCFRPM